MDVIHYPRLDTMLAVEEFIKKHSGEYRKKALWQNLPKKMMYQTYSLILDYLEKSGKIARDREEKIAWIWNPRLVERYLKHPDYGYDEKQGRLCRRQNQRLIPKANQKTRRKQAI